MWFFMNHIFSFKNMSKFSKMLLFVNIFEIFKKISPILDFWNFQNAPIWTFSEVKIYIKKKIEKINRKTKHGEANITGNLHGFRNTLHSVYLEGGVVISLLQILEVGFQNENPFTIIILNQRGQLNIASFRGSFSLKKTI